MIPYAGDKERIINGKAKEAITLALQGHWDEAVIVNGSILRDFPGDMEACNRLGKALSELGRYGEAKEAFRQALKISRANIIAMKNLRRLAHLEEGTAFPKHGSRVVPQLFMGDMGKTARASLIKLSPSRAHLSMAPGDAVRLRSTGHEVAVEGLQGRYLGEIDPRLASRISRLIGRGNTYAAAVVAVDEQSMIVMIKETYRHPSLEGKASFPPRGAASELRPYPSTPPLPAELELEETEEGLVRSPITDWDEDGEDATADQTFEEEGEERSTVRGEFEEDINY